MDDHNILTSKAYKRAESNLRDKLKPGFLKHYPHFMVPGYNLNNISSLEDWDIENIVEQYQDFPFHCDLPRLLLPPAKLPRCVLDEEDPALELLTTKAHMSDDIKRLKHYYHKHKKELGVVRKKDIKWVQDNNSVNTTVPKYIADVAEIIEMEPDSYFQGAYNWYYTGGSMDYVQLGNSNILLFPFGGELVAAPIITTEDFVWQPLLKNASKCKLDSTLYELKSSTIDNTCKVLGRFKYHLNLYTLSVCNNKHKIKKIHKQTSKIPLVSADLNLFNANQYCTLNAERSVTLWDLTKTKYISSYSVLQSKTLDDSWGNIKFQPMDPNIILFMDRCCVHYLDIRIKYDQPVLTLCPKSYLEKCESLSLDVTSRHSSYSYIGTYHSLLLCDNRSPKQCIQQKWTHQFKSTPLMACVANREDKEIIILSSQLAGESSIILNTWTSEETSHSFNLPFTPPHIMETLNESQLQGMCLNPYLRYRFELCNTGSAVIKNETGDVFLFLQNSIGDVYYQCVTHDTALDKYSSINCKSYCTLDAWDKILSTQHETIVPLTISDKCNMQNVYKCLSNKNLTLKCNDEALDEDFDPSWKQSINKLESYIDILAPELLAVWEVCEEVPLPLTAVPHQKVLSWLESSNTKSLFQSQEEPEDVTPVNTQELISVSQEQNIAYLDDSNVLQELLLPKVRTKPVKKKRKL